MRWTYCKQLGTDLKPKQSKQAGRDESLGDQIDRRDEVESQWEEELDEQVINIFGPTLCPLGSDLFSSQVQFLCCLFVFGAL
jgi:hypothetical protein